MNYSLQLMKAIGALVGVLGLFYLLVKFIKERNFLNQTDQIKILERCYLDSNKFICLVAVTEEVWLVTVSDEQLEFVKKVDLTVDDIAAQETSSSKLLELFYPGNNEDENDES